MKTIEVDVSLDEWTSDELIEELEVRGDMPERGDDSEEDFRILVCRESIEEVWRDMQGRDVPQSLKAMLEGVAGRIWMN